MFVQRRQRTSRHCAQASEVCRRVASHFATRALCFIVWCPMAGCKVEVCHPSSVAFKWFSHKIKTAQLILNTSPHGIHTCYLWKWEIKNYQCGYGCETSYSTSGIVVMVDGWGWITVEWNHFLSVSDSSLSSTWNK